MIKDLPHGQTQSDQQEPTALEKYKNGVMVSLEQWESALIAETWCAALEHAAKIAEERESEPGSDGHKTGYKHATTIAAEIRKEIPK